MTTSIATAGLFAVILEALLKCWPPETYEKA
jgi:hypothetical protein